jgi:hypothetical protein
MVATLKDAEGQPLNQKRVSFLVRDQQGNHIHTSIAVTDPTGRAVLAAIPVVPASYTVKACFGSAVYVPDAVPAVTLNFEDPCYLACESGTETVELDYTAPILCHIEYVGDTVSQVGSDLRLAAQVTATALPQGNGEDYSLAIVRFSLALDGRVEIDAPVTSDGRSFAVVNGLAGGLHTLTIQVVGGAFTSAPEVVTVAIGPADSFQELSELRELMDLLLNLGLPKGTETSLKAKLNAAAQKLAVNDVAGACNSLQAFINEVKALKGKKIPANDAATLTAAANEIRTLLNCP